LKFVGCLLSCRHGSCEPYTRGYRMNTGPNVSLSW